MVTVHCQEQGCPFTLALEHLAQDAARVVNEYLDHLERDHGICREELDVARATLRLLKH